MKITPASIHFNDQGTPVASQFDDVYFSNDDGLAESEFVFLQHNGLPQRWQTMGNTRFVIGETGFGTGLNFLLSWQRFLAETDCGRLHFISIEKFPLAPADLRDALSHWPQLASYSQQLIDQYPLPIPGCHRLTFAKGRVILDLWFGDIHEVLPAIHSRPEGLIDAFYLDGFAPSKNPDMWSDTLFNHMARLGKHQSSFSTFTAAGLVKRGLANVGYHVNKVDGFGRKRNMLCGTLDRSRVAYQHHAFERSNSSAAPERVAIIGAGLAGASVANALARQGVDCDVFFASPQPADGASGNLQGGFYPQLHIEPSIASQLQAHSFLFACRRYQQLRATGYHFEGDFCGVIQTGFNEAQTARLTTLCSNGHWPNELVRLVTPQQATSLAGVHLPYTGAYFRDGGWINPPSLVNALFEEAGQQASIQLFAQHQLLECCYQNGWQLRFTQGQNRHYDLVIFATGAESNQFALLDPLPFTPVRGQVESVRASESSDRLNCVICHKGYFTPAWQGYHAMGSSYVKHDMSRAISDAESAFNLDTLRTSLSDAVWVNDIQICGQARASQRMTTPDHQPVMGAIADFAAQAKQYAMVAKSGGTESAMPPVNHPNAFVLSGLGSRGLCTAPLMAEALACQIMGKPLPLPSQLLDALNPNRFLIKQLKRGVNPFAASSS